MVTAEPVMIGDSQFLVCRGERSCGALVKTDVWPFHVEFHLRLDGVNAAIRDGVRRAS